MRILKLIPAFLLILTATVAAVPTHAQAGGTSAEVSTDAIHSRLVAEHSTITPGQSFRVAWQMRLDPHWHVYWQNPGDSGLPPVLEAQNGFTSTPLSFPAPKAILIDPVMNYGYENAATFLTTVTAPAGLPEGPVQLPVTLTYLYCSDICLPGEISTTIPLTVGSHPVANPAFAEAERAHISSLPQPMPEGAALQAGLAENASRTVVLNFNPAALNNPASVRFIPQTESWLHDSGAQAYTRSGSSARLELAFDPYAPESSPDKLEGLLIVQDGQGNSIPYTVSTPIGGALAGGPNAALSLLPALAAAFLAGLILNVMPCVLPVLSLKLLSLVRHHSSASRRRHTLAYTAGVLVSFWAFALTIGILQAGGEQLGWGFHLQNPLFVAALTTLMLGVALNFFGVFELGQRLTKLGGAPARETTLGSTATGVLAVVVATPCTVPFMGGAVAYALGQGLFGSLLVFTALGLGMASPFLLAAAQPKLLRWLPKPGAWMLTFRHLLGWPMLATALWLLWVFANQTATAATFLLLILLLALAFTLWFYGFKRHLLTRLLVVLPIALGAWLLPPLVSLPTSGTANAHATNWQSWSPEAVAAARAEGKQVFIDFTADWCITCKVTEATVLDTTAVQTMFKQKNVSLFKADWTRRDAAITAELAKHGRKGVPLYLAYKNGQESAEILPQLLTPGYLEETFTSPAE